MLLNRKIIIFFISREARIKVLQVLILVGIVFLPVFSVLSRAEGLVFAQNEELLQQTEKEKAELERQLREIEEQITRYKNELNGIKGERNTLENKIRQLQKQQSTISLQIKTTNLLIADLDDRLGDTEIAIDEGVAKIEKLQQEMTKIIRLINEYDDFPLLYVVFSQESLSDAFGEAERYLQISESLKELFNETVETKDYLGRQMEIMADQQEEARNLLSVKALQQQQLSGSMNEQSSLLKETKGRENNYQAVLSDTQKKAAEIRNRLYDLLGVKTQITFGEAVGMAQWVSAQTGVRAAFLLAVLTQESNLGKNVGTCNRLGDPPEKSWKVIMKPSRDHQPFLRITDELGLDSDTTPVSCPMFRSGKQIGWGGAMGPAQFIPSTWMGYKSRIEALTGRTANPWDIRDAFIAAAIKLGNDGAKSQSGEWAAAMRYFSGSTNTRYRFYGDNVVALAKQYQADIDSMTSN